MDIVGQMIGIVSCARKIDDDRLIDSYYSSGRNFSRIIFNEKIIRSKRRRRRLTGLLSETNFELILELKGKLRQSLSFA